jgi:hypothetical protein
MISLALLCGHLVGDFILQNDYLALNKTRAHFPCLVHCLLYTLAVFLFAFPFLHPLACLPIFVLHYPLDRYALARRWMLHVSRQQQFATGPCAPWSVIVVDNTFHLVVLYLTAILLPR